MKRMIATMCVLVCMSFVCAYAQDEVEVKGLITGRTGDSMTVRDPEGATHVVTLNDETKIQAPKGLGLRHQQMSWTELIPGLRVTVKGEHNTKNQIVAHEVEFKKSDLQTASMIQAGMTPTENKVQANQQQISENKGAIASNQQAISENQQAIAATKQQVSQNEKEVDQRFSSLADYETKGNLNVYFPSGSYDISEKDKAALTQLAADAQKIPGYLIQVQGYADSTGALAMNQTLSRDRAESVSEYLMQECRVSPRHVLAPGAMGISDPVASNETTQGRSENRRVNVKVLANKGVAGS
jgi:OmpA-OmpF porin, OOP family